MSATDEGAVASPAGAMAVEIRAAHWVALRRNRAGWSTAQQADLDVWLSESLAHRVAYIRIEATWRRTDRLAALRPPMREPADLDVPRRAVWMRLAGTIGLATVLAGPFFSDGLLRSHGQVIETPRGGQERLTLADGSRIELNTDTAVRVDLRKDSRAIELIRGEAYFEIKHNTARPFVVTAAGHRIVDLGTKFVVRMAPQAVQIALLQGSARLETDGASSRKAPIVLSPGDVAVATTSATHVTRQSSRQISERLAWQDGSIVFHRTRLADAIAEFNRYGGPRLVVTGDAATTFKINGTFSTTGAEDFAAVTHELFGLMIEHKDGAIILSREAK